MGNYRASDAAGLVKELVHARTSDKEEAAEASRKVAQAELDAIMGWFQPIMDTAKSIKDDKTLGGKLFAFVTERIIGGTGGQSHSAHVDVRIAANSLYAAECRAFTFVPCEGSVRISICSGRSGQESVAYHTVGGAIAIMLSAVADMVRHR